MTHLHEPQAGGAADALVLDLVEWVAREPRLYVDVLDAWRTSCPRLTIWEDSVDRGYVERRAVAGGSATVTVTRKGERLLRDSGRWQRGLAKAEPAVPAPV